ncbi:MFS general substrate transporter [Hygrophoropsis aurantiaca]|uniref:MFS general substrate transporter n=1 Tax=Hygrophoropsis aurantiaca TaxID=72124 RepID=A0ACB8AR01_9AGAM|nr:MFS general substrate transporter [Hygrophoropsis aurantiaca]
MTMADSQSTNLAPINAEVNDDTDTQLQKKPTALETKEKVIKLDIEHAIVENDPRIWSTTRKNVVLFIISGASMIAGLSANIQNPANAQIEQELHASPGDISLSLSLFILVQGNFPVLWSAISEIKGRKIVYLLSVSLFTLGSAIVAISKTIGLVIGMRIVQAAGSSAVIAIGAATLADMYEPHQRGTMMGIYYAAPLLGPSVAPIVAGGLVQGLGWRAVFWFLVIWGAIIFLAFLLLFQDTFRRERSLTYQNVLKKRIRSNALAKAKADSQDTVSHPSTEEKITKNASNQDPEAQTPTIVPAAAIKEVKLSLADVNPFPPYLKIIGRTNNLAILIPSGLLFAFSFSIAYTCARTLANTYQYDALKTGLVLLAYGIGSVAGSILGGRWSDRTLAKLKVKYEGKSYPEMRLESTKIAMWWLPPSVIGYAWVCQERVHVAAMCVMLFLAGFFSIWIYTSTLAYIVDANVGRSSTAVATNSSFRGLSAFVAAEVAVPLQDAIGDGGLYTLWAGLLVIAQLLILLVLYRGAKWREESEKREKAKAEES